MGSLLERFNSLYKTYTTLRVTKICPEKPVICKKNLAVNCKYPLICDNKLNQHQKFLKMKLFKTAFLLLAAISIVEAQNCTAYIPHEKGAKLEFGSYDKKGNLEGIVKQEITDVKQSSNSTVFSIQQVMTDEKGEEPVEVNMEFECRGDVFIVDMNSFISGEQAQSFEDMNLEINVEDLEIPNKLEPGQNLKDGKLTMSMSGDSPMAMNIFSVSVKNRKVEAKETITTPAGTFECVKLSQDIVSKTGFAITMNSVEWYAEGVGAVKTETWRKGKLIGYTELLKLEKP